MGDTTSSFGVQCAGCQQLLEHIIPIVYIIYVGVEVYVFLQYTLNFQYQSEFR